MCNNIVEDHFLRQHAGVWYLTPRKCSDRPHIRASESKSWQSIKSFVEFGWKLADCSLSGTGRDLFGYAPAVKLMVNVLLRNRLARL